MNPIIIKLDDHSLNVSYKYKKIIALSIYKELKKISMLSDDSNYSPKFYFEFHFIRDIESGDIDYSIQWGEGHIGSRLLKFNINQYNEIENATKQQYDQYMCLYDMNEIGNECPVSRAIFSGFLKSVIEINDNNI